MAGKTSFHHLTLKQAADLFLLQQQLPYEFMFDMEMLLHEGRAHEAALKTGVDVIGTRARESYRKAIGVLFDQAYQELLDLWTDEESSILSALPGVQPWLPEKEMQKLNDLAATICASPRPCFMNTRFDHAGVLLSLFDYFQLALSGCTVFPSRYDKGVRLDESKREALSWLLKDLDFALNPSGEKDCGYYGYAVLRNFKALTDEMKLDDTLRIRKVSRIEWNELLLPEDYVSLQRMTGQRREPRDLESLRSEAEYLINYEEAPFFIIEGWCKAIDESETEGPLGDLLRQEYSIVVRRIQDLVSCIRLVHDTSAGVVGIATRGLRPILPPSTSGEKAEYGPPVRSSYSHLSGEAIDARPRALVLRNTAELMEFWNAFRAFMDNEPRTDFHRNYERALTRYNQSIVEYYLEDAIVDLSTSLEILTRGGGPATSYRVAAFVSPDAKISQIQEVMREFLKLRNDCVHGPGLRKRKDVEKAIGYFKRAKVLVQACLRNAVFMHVNGAIPSGDTGFRNLLDACVVSFDERRRIQDLIPKWSLQNVSESLSGA